MEKLNNMLGDPGHTTTMSLGTWKAQAPSVLTYTVNETKTFLFENVSQILSGPLNRGFHECTF